MEVERQSMSHISVSNQPSRHDSRRAGETCLRGAPNPARRSDSVGGCERVWGDNQCIASTGFASLQPTPARLLTEIGTVAANPGYPVSSRPAPGLEQIIGAEGAC